MFEIFSYEFMQRAFIAGIGVGIIAPLVGTFLVVRRYAPLADTLAHVSFVGIAIGLITGISPLFAAFGATVAAAFGIEYLRETRRLFGESILVLFLSGSLGIAELIISFAREFNAGLLNFLFGSIATVTTADVYATLALCAAATALAFAFYKELFLVSFDDELARASGLRVRFFNLMIIVLAAITVTLAMRIVGILLVSALMVIPVLAAQQFQKSFKKTMLLSIGFSLCAVIAGLSVSYYAGLSSGGAIVGILLLIFVASLFAGRKK